MSIIFIAESEPAQLRRIRIRKRKRVIRHDQLSVVHQARTDDEHLARETMSPHCLLNPRHVVRNPAPALNRTSLQVAHQQATCHSCSVGRVPASPLGAMRGALCQRGSPLPQSRAVHSPDNR